MERSKQRLTGFPVGRLVAVGNDGRSPFRRALTALIAARPTACPVNGSQTIGLSRRADPATEASPLRSQWAIRPWRRF
jgi:hypothetical protein